MTEKHWKRLLDSKPGLLYGADASNGIDRAIRKWKKTVKDAGIVQECFNRREFIKPSKQKRKILQSARYRMRKSSANEI